jgi:hypothetical protein
MPDAARIRDTVTEAYACLVTFEDCYEPRRRRYAFTATPDLVVESW